jgi:hypothetical protein
VKVCGSSRRRVFDHNHNPLPAADRFTEISVSISNPFVLSASGGWQTCKARYRKDIVKITAMGNLERYSPYDSQRDEHENEPSSAWEAVTYHWSKPENRGQHFSASIVYVPSPSSMRTKGCSMISKAELWHSFSCQTVLTLAPFSRAILPSCLSIPSITRMCLYPIP